MVCPMSADVAMYVEPCAPGMAAQPLPERSQRSHVYP